MYNQYNLKANASSDDLENIINIFKSFLNSEKISKGSIRSYLSDTRQFLFWLEGFLQNAHRFTQISSRFTRISENPPAISENLIIILKYINEPVLKTYKEYLGLNNIPTKTINRRFSSLRRFGAFCQDQKWCSTNPFDTLRNISLNTSFPEDQYHLGEFKVSLWKNNSSKATIKNYLADVKQFLLWQAKTI